MANREGGLRGGKGEDVRGQVTTGDLESVINRIPGVQAGRVVLGPGGRITEVHVLATQERGAKQLVRDVQSSLLARFGVDVDYRIVSIVQLHENGPSEGLRKRPEDPAPPPDVRDPLQPGRPALSRIASESDGLVTTVTVDVVHEGATMTGQARGAATAGNRLVAHATIDAVGKLVGEHAIEVDASELVPAHVHRVAVVVLRLAGTRGEHIVAGSALVRKDASDAIARATLDAVNRVIKSA